MNIAEAQALRYGAQIVKTYPDWIPTSERLPESNTTVLVVANKGSIFMMYFGLGNSGVDEWFHNDCEIRPYMIPKYWMPLPELPKE